MIIGSDKVFNNNINGNKNRIKINQNNGEKSNNVIMDIIIGLIITVVGGIILFFIIGEEYEKFSIRF